MQATRKIFSTTLYDPLTTSSQTRIALIGTDRYLLMPNISRLAAIPANSETEFPMLVRKRAIIT